MMLTASAMPIWRMTLDVSANPIGLAPFNPSICSEPNAGEGVTVMKK
jgi:hypothetical protein